MKDWYKLYKSDIENNGGIREYYTKKVRHRKQLIKKICHYSRGKIVEAGCGSGVLSIELSRAGNQVIAVDNDKRMLKIVDDISQEIIKKKIETMNFDIFEIDKKLKSENINTIFSVGVFEHFTDEEIIDLLKKQMSVAEYVFVAIPTQYFDDSEALYGNERFLPYKKWRELIHLANGKIINEFSCQNQGILERIKNTRKYFRPAPIRVFIVKEGK